MNRLCNRLLRKVPSDVFASLAQDLILIEVAQNQTLIEIDEPIPYVYFPETCVCCVLALTKRASPIEVAMFGSEGMSNFAVQSWDRSLLRTIVILPGQTWRISAARFEDALRNLPALHELFLRYKEFGEVQLAFTSAANGVFAISARLARCLLMLQDKSRLDAFPLVHQQLAAVLRVRRSGVTNAVHVLEGSGAITAKRGLIRIRDRTKLLEIAGDSYGAAEQAYQQLMGY